MIRAWSQLADCCLNLTPIIVLKWPALTLMSFGTALIDSDYCFWTYLHNVGNLTNIPHCSVFRDHLNVPCCNLLLVLLFARWVIFHAFLLYADFFQNQLFQKILSGIPPACQSVWIQIRTDISLGLIWVQTVWTGYQQTTLVGNALMYVSCWYCEPIFDCECYLLKTFTNSLDPDQAWKGVRPDLDLECLTLWWYSWKNVSIKSWFWKKVSWRQISWKSSQHAELRKGSHFLWICLSFFLCV